MWAGQSRVEAGKEVSIIPSGKVETSHANP